MKYAIIELAGRQFMVKEGDILEVTRQNELSCRTIFYKNEEEVKVGMPYLEDILIDLEKLEDKKDTKVIVARYKSKSRYRRKNGHRQPISVIRVGSIGPSSGGKTEQIKPTKKVKKEESEEIK
jgi:large subunit ribosomal protein L21